MRDRVFRRGLDSNNPESAQDLGKLQDLQALRLTSEAADQSERTVIASQAPCAVVYVFGRPGSGHDLDGEGGRAAAECGPVRQSASYVCAAPRPAAFSGTGEAHRCVGGVGLPGCANRLLKTPASRPIRRSKIAKLYARRAPGQDGRIIAASRSHAALHGIEQMRSCAFR